MHQFRMTLGGVAFALLIWGAVAGPAVLEAQVTGPGPDGRWPLQPTSPGNNTLAPFMEGWYANEDGTYSISFGYVNTNLDTLYIPVGESNFLDQAQFDGMQPTVFFPGRHRGVFGVTLPGAMRDTDIWWTVTTKYGDVTRVPGRIGAVAYELDWMPRASRQCHSPCFLRLEFRRGPRASGHLRRTYGTRSRLDLPSPCRSTQRTLRREIWTTPEIRGFPFAWCGPSSKVPDRWSTRDTSPTLRWRKRTTTLLPLLDDEMSRADPRLSGFRRGRALPA